jgi:hypothetical protein
MSNWKAIVAAAVAVLAIAAAGCGGDDDETTAAQTLTKDEFIAQADEICAAGDDEIEAAAQDLGASPSQEEATQLVTDVALPSVQEQRDSIAALGAPEGDEDEVQAILASLDEAIAAVEADPASVLSSSSDPDNPFAEVDQLAQDYGLTDCGNG